MFLTFVSVIFFNVVRFTLVTLVCYQKYWQIVGEDVLYLKGTSLKGDTY